jgi:septal ring factor EnvC (AmiA/AmiB activator)
MEEQFEQRRHHDIRINRMEDKLDEMQKDISLIKQKIFNGFSETIKQQSVDIKEIKKTVAEVDRKAHRSDAERLSDCPLKKEMVQKYEKQFLKVVAVITVIVGLIASLPGWINLL